MMDSEKHGFKGTNQLESNEEMENLIIDDPLSIRSYVDSHITFSPVFDMEHPLSFPSVSISTSDPSISSTAHREFRSPVFSDPSSYAEVIFSPFEEENGSTNGIESVDENSRILNFSAPVALRSDYLKISVSNPQKEQESANPLVPGTGTYVTYLITTKTNILDYGGSEFKVRRRFRDVVTLADRLSESYRGFFVPPRPDKNVVESQMMQKQEFVEQRRVSLEKYLLRLAAHPVIKKSDELKIFLQVQGKLPLPSTTDVASRMLDGAVNLPRQLFGDSTSVIAPQDVVQPAKGGRDLLRIFKELKQSVANDWGGSKPLVIEEDKAFLEKKEKLHDLERNLSIASEQAESLVKAQQDIADTMGKLGLSFVKLTKFETEEALYTSQRVRAAETKLIATAMVKASRLYRESNEKTVKCLDILHDYLGLMLAIQSAFSDRSSALLTVQTIMSELNSLRSKAEKLEATSSKIFGGDKSRIHKIEELREMIKVTEDAKNCAIQQYGRIKDNNWNELERIEKERHSDFLSMLKGFVTNQVGYSEKIANVWKQIVEETRSYAKEKELKL